MRIRSTVLQILILIVAAAAIAVIANGFAAPRRRLVLPGHYPDALRVPARQPESVPPPAVTATIATTTTAQSPAPDQPPVVVPATTIERPAETTTTDRTDVLQPKRSDGLQPVEGGLKPAPAPPPAPPADPLARFTPHPDKAYVEIAGDDVMALHRADALFLDARRTSVFEDGHIAGARSFSVWEADIDDKVNALFNERSDPRDQNLPIVIYCSGGACEDSHMLAQKLWGIQFNNIYVYKDGFPDWQKRGGSVRTGANP